jgi:hypothetical protein
MTKTSFLALLILGISAGLSGGPREKVHREFARTSEREVSVIIDVAFGSLVFEKGTGAKVAVVDYDEGERENRKIQVSYDVADGHGTLRVKLKKASERWIWNGSDDDERHGTITVQVTGDLPLDVDIELGAGKGDLDLSGLRVSELHISTGASNVNLRCEKPNGIEASDISIESGVSKFTATDLCNLNFEKFRFSGGVGSYKLDFGGTSSRNGDARLEVGLGAIVINVPRHLQVRLAYDDNWLSSFDLDEDFQKKRGGVYETDGYPGSDPHLTLKVEAGLGSVKIRRR